MGIFDNTYRTVHKTVKGYSDKPFDLAELKRKDKQTAAMEAATAHNEKVMEDWKKEQSKKTMEAALFGPQRLAAVKTAALNKISETMPDKFVEEVFAHIYSMALPHDEQFIIDNWNTITAMGEFYIRKLGGMKYLKTVESASPFLHKVYMICDEAAKKAVKKRSEKVIKALTDEEIYDNIHNQVTQDERDEVIKHIDALGAEELAELVKEKIISVVKDEHVREKEAKDFRTDLKNDLTDDTEVNAEVGAVNSEENAPDEGAGAEESTLTIHTFPSLEATMERWDPMHKNFMYDRDAGPTTLFFAICTDVARDCVRLKAATEGKTILPVKETPDHLLTNPLNLDVFSNYMQDNRSGDDIWIAEKVSEPEGLGYNTGDINGDRIMTEAVLQYALFETAYTLKMINPTMTQIKEQAEWLLRD